MLHYEALLNLPFFSIHPPSFLSRVQAQLQGPFNHYQVRISSIFLSTPTYSIVYQVSGLSDLLPLLQGSAVLTTQELHRRLHK